MFKSVVIQVIPAEAESISPHTGPALRAWFLRLVRVHTPRLADALHDDEGLRPYTLSDVVGLGPIRQGRRLLSPERAGWLRITTLTPDLSALLTERILPMLPGAEIDLDGALVRIKAVMTTSADHPWAGSTSPHALIAAGSLAAKMPRRLNMRFVSATTFKSEGLHVPFPLPRLLFGSLLNRWNDCAPVELHPDTRRFADLMIAASKYHLRSHYLTFGPEKGAAVGCTGSCRYYVGSGDKYWLGIIHTLALFAFYAGVGARTTIGMGQAALWDHEQRRPVTVTTTEGE